MISSLMPTRGDIFGGLAAGVVALPLCLALGLVSGLGPAAGLYGAIVLGILGAILGGTPVQVSGPTTPMALVAAGVVAANLMSDGHPDIAVIAMVFLMAGAIQVAFGLLRLGVFMRFVPYPVISGFMSGIGLIIILQQVFPLLGAAPPSSSPAEIISHLHTLPALASLYAGALGVATLAIITLLPRLTRVLPAPLVALVVVTATSLAFGLTVPRIGAIPAGLPDLVIPRLDSAQLTAMLVAALELALLGSIDTLLGSLMVDNMTRTHHDSNRELIGQGIGNMAAALVGGLPGAGASIRTVVNIEAGATGRASGVIHGIFLIAVMLGLSGIVGQIPNAVLAGILVTAGVGIFDHRAFLHIARVPRADAALMLLVTLLTVFMGLIVAVLCGLVIGALIFMKKIADAAEARTTLSAIADEPWSDELDLAPIDRDHLLIKHVDGPLFFGFARAFRDISAAATHGRLLVLRMDRVGYIDQSGAYALQDLLVDLKSNGLQVAVVGLPIAQLDVLRNLRMVPDVLSERDIYPDFAEFRHALPRILQDIDAA